MTSGRPTNNATAVLPPTVRLERGKGDLPCVRVAGPGGSAEIYLQGAHLTSWRPVGQEPVIWESRASAYSPGVPIRGGVPICFPWFGPNAKDAAAPLHGFARLHDWTLIEATEVNDDVCLTFALEDSDQTRSTAWPFRFQASYRVVVGATLQLALEITNRDTQAFPFEEALHSYFAVADIRDVAIQGLTGASYLDRTGGAEPILQGVEPVRIEGETDRMYVDTSATVTIEDTPGDRLIQIRKDGSASTVVWNPWVDKAAAMADFGDDEWVEMICVEACNAGSTEVLLAPGEQHRMTTTIEVLPLRG